MLSKYPQIRDLVMGLGLTYYKLRFSSFINFQRCLDALHLLDCCFTYLSVKNRYKEMQRRQKYLKEKLFQICLVQFAFKIKIKN